MKCPAWDWPAPNIYESAAVKARQGFEILRFTPLGAGSPPQRTRDLWPETSIPKDIGTMFAVWRHEQVQQVLGNHVTHLKDAC